jgi:hypothetical protein
VSWGAILSGAVAAAVLSLILLMLGVGLGLSSASPWSGRGASAETLGTSAILWVILTQLLSGAMGGYLAGRLRTKWTEVHVDEVYFRDTAHGFLAWGIASLATAALLTASIGSIVGAGVQAGATAAAESVNDHVVANGYFVDTLFRRSAASQANAVVAPVNEVARVLTHALVRGQLSPEDIQYVGQLVAEVTGVSQQQAQKRLTDSFAQLQTQLNTAAAKTKEAADRARATSAHAALWLFISLLIGAFIASWAATLGGRCRGA